MKVLNRLSNIYIIMLMMLFLLNYIFKFDVDYIYIGLLTSIVVFLMLLSATGLMLIFTIAMLITGVIVLLMTGEPLKEWFPLFTNNMTLIILILFVPILAIPLNLGKYNIEVEKILIKVSKKPGLLYSGITTTLFILGSIINLGSLSVIHVVANNNGFSKEFLGRAYVRGFTSTIIWSPFFASVFLIINALDVSVGKFILYSLSLGIIQLIMSNIWFNLTEKRTIKMNVSTEKIQTIKKGKVSVLLLVLSLLIIIILVSERIVQGNMSIMITVIVVVYSFLWSFFIKKAKEFHRKIYSYLSNIVPGRVNEILLFLTAGFFSGAISITNVGDGIQSVFIVISNISIFLLIFTIISVTVLLALVGIHQIVTITLLLASINVVEIGVTNLTFALILTCSWSISTLISPITPVNIISSRMLHVRVFDLIKWNYQFAIVLIFTYSIIIYMYNLLLF